MREGEEVKKIRGMMICCPKCHGPTTVNDSRGVKEGTVVRRRRECVKASCKARFTTIELIASKGKPSMGVSMAKKIQEQYFAQARAEFRKQFKALLGI